MTNTHSRGFTLIELLVVIAILSIMATFAAVKIGSILYRAKITAAEHDLQTIAEAFMDPESGYVRDHRGLPGFSLGNLRIANLLIATNNYGIAADGGDVKVAEFKWSDEAEKGWRGPYLKNSSGVFPSKAAYPDNRGFWPRLDAIRVPDDFKDGYLGCSIYGFPGEPAVIDPWGNPYVLQIPPPQAFADEYNSNSNILASTRFKYARVVSAGPDGRLETPCFTPNYTNVYFTTWGERDRRLSRQAGRIDITDVSARGDDLVLFLMRSDTDEGEGTRLLPSAANSTARP